MGSANTTVYAQWQQNKLGVIINQSYSEEDIGLGRRFGWQNTTGRSVTLTVRVYSYCEYLDDGYCYTYFDVATSSTAITNQALYGVVNTIRTETLTIPDGYYIAFYIEGNVTSASVYVAEE